MTEISNAEYQYRAALVTAAATIVPHRQGVALQEIIGFLHTGVEQAMKPAPIAPPEPERKPVVTARASVTHDKVTCMACGFVGKSLKRHIRQSHGQTPEQYREYWGLKSDHPIVAPGYSETRSKLAKANGLGKKVTP